MSSSEKRNNEFFDRLGLGLATRSVLKVLLPSSLNRRLFGGLSNSSSYVKSEMSMSSERRGGLAGVLDARLEGAGRGTWYEVGGGGVEERRSMMSGIFHDSNDHGRWLREMGGERCNVAGTCFARPARKARCHVTLYKL